MIDVNIKIFEVKDKKYISGPIKINTNATVKEILNSIFDSLELKNPEQFELTTVPINENTMIGNVLENSSSTYKIKREV